MEQVADLKEVFMLYDMDEDGVLNFNELEQVLCKALKYSICYDDDII